MAMILGGVLVLSALPAVARAEVPDPALPNQAYAPPGAGVAFQTPTNGAPTLRQVYAAQGAFYVYSTLYTLYVMELQQQQMLLQQQQMLEQQQQMLQQILDRQGAPSESAPAQ